MESESVSIPTTPKLLKRSQSSKYNIYGKKQLSIRDEAKLMLIKLQEKEELKKKLLEEQEINRKKEEHLKYLHEEEQKRLAIEAKTKRYFQLNSFNRKIPADDDPIYVGDFKCVSKAWIPDGQGQFFLNVDDLKLEGNFKNGMLEGIGKVYWRDGIEWEGNVKNNRIFGDGIIVTKNGSKKPAIANDNNIVAYQEVKHVLNWKYLLRFHDEVIPKERVVDLGKNYKFKVLKHLPTFHLLESYDISVNPKPINDYRYKQDSMADLIVKNNINILQIDNNIKDNNNNLEVSSSLKNKSNKSHNQLNQNNNIQYNHIQNNLNFYNKKYDYKTMPSASYLPQFPTRKYEDSLENMFESFEVGIGVARLEEEEAMRKELKKKQFAALIAQRRSEMEQEKQKKIADEQENYLKNAMEEQKKIQQKKKDEEDSYNTELQEAIEQAKRDFDDQLSVNSKGSKVSALTLN
eukprot:gene10483-14086_t